MVGQIIDLDLNGDQIINGLDIGELLNVWDENSSAVLSDILANYGTMYGTHSDGTLHIIPRHLNPEWSDSPFEHARRLSWDSGFYNYNHLTEPRMIRFAIDQFDEPTFPVQNILIGLTIGLAGIFIWRRYAKRT